MLSRGYSITFRLLCGNLLGPVARTKSLLFFPLAFGQWFWYTSCCPTHKEQFKWQENLKIVSVKLLLNSSFIDDLGADSLDSVELIMAFEEEFGAAIPEEDAEKLTTVGKVIDYLKSKGYGDDASTPAQ